MEPRPWPEDGATEIEQALLRAGRADGPRKGADLRLLAMLQGPPPAPVKPVSLARWVKIGAVAVAAGGAALVTQQVGRRHAEAPKQAQPVAVAMPVEAPRTIPAPPSPAIETSESAMPVVAPSSPAVAARRHATVARASDRSTERPLGEETRALDRARVALDDHRAGDALRMLDEYGRRFPQGRLRPESMILRLSALVQDGRRGAAESLAHQLLSDATYEPYAARIQSLLREARP